MELPFLSQKQALSHVLSEHKHCKDLRHKVMDWCTAQEAFPCFLWLLHVLCHELFFCLFVFFEWLNKRISEPFWRNNLQNKRTFQLLTIAQLCSLFTVTLFCKRIACWSIGFSFRCHVYTVEMWQWPAMIASCVLVVCFPFYRAQNIYNTEHPVQDVV